MWAFMRTGDGVCLLSFRDGTPSGGPECRKYEILLDWFGFSYLVGLRIFLILLACKPRGRGLPIDCSGLTFVDIPWKTDKG